MASSPEVAYEGLDSTSVGILSSSSRDCCDEGMMRSSEEHVEEGDVAEEDVMGGGTVEVSCCAEGATSSYPDPPSVNMTSGAPSIESRRDRSVVVTLLWP